MSLCGHLFEQNSADRLPGTYTTCQCCKDTVFSPEYASCVKCGRLLCVRCIVVIPLGHDWLGLVWSEETTDKATCEAITDRYLIDLSEFEDSD